MQNGVCVGGWGWAVPQGPKGKPGSIPGTTTSAMVPSGKTCAPGRQTVWTDPQEDRPCSLFNAPVHSEGRVAVGWVVRVWPPKVRRGPATVLQRRRPSHGLHCQSVPQDSARSPPSMFETRTSLLPGRGQRMGCVEGGAGGNKKKTQRQQNHPDGPPLYATALGGPGPGGCAGHKGPQRHSSAEGVTARTTRCCRWC